MIMLMDDCTGEVQDDKGSWHASMEEYWEKCLQKADKKHDERNDEK